MTTTQTQRGTMNHPTTFSHPAACTGQAGITTRVRQGRSYPYDPITKLLFNPETSKWVQNPLPRRRIVTSHKKAYYHPLIDPLLERISSNTAELESIRYVLKGIAIKSNLRIKRGLDEPYDLPDDASPPVWIHSQFYYRLLGANYLRVLHSLENAGILTSWVHKTPNRRYPLYWFTDDRFLSGYSLEPITCQSVEEKIEGYHLWSTRHLAESDNKVATQAIDNFWKITLDEEQFKAITE